MGQKLAARHGNHHGRHLRIYLRLNNHKSLQRIDRLDGVGSFHNDRFLSGSLHLLEVEDNAGSTQLREILPEEALPEASALHALQ